MIKAFLALGIAAVAVTTVPADAKRYSNVSRCQKWHNGHCTKWHRLSVRQAQKARYNVGYRFGPRYAYTSYRMLPRTYVSRYDLNPNYRYVYRDNYIYVVNPRTYAIERIISALVR